MSRRLQAPRGTFDVLGEQALARERLEADARRILERAGYNRIETPTFEATELFARGVGESTDVVQKEMYTFADDGDQSYTLRPEGTAPVCRAYLEHGMHKLPQPVKLWYLSSFFRRERPQAGRYRQFWQVGAEAIGSDDPAVDAEIVLLLAELLEAVGTKGVRLRIGSLGSPEARVAYREQLQGYLRAHEAELSAEVVSRIDLNPLRALDADHPAPRRVMERAPRLLDALAPEDAEHFAEVLAFLDAAGLAHEVDTTLVRGLDYYTRTVFEVVSGDLGAQDAILGGGRYDGLVESLGGPPLPGIGFAIGEDRLLQVAPLPLPRRPCVVVLPQKPDDLAEANRIAREIRAVIPSGCVEVDLAARGLKKGMARASALFEEADARGFDREGMLAVLVGERERAEGSVTVKRLATGEQETFSRADLAEKLGAARER